MGGTEDVSCGGCGADVPDVDGASHPYIVASPGCWQLYGEWMARRSDVVGGDPVVNAHHVDCYAVQHPDGAEQDRRQRQSVAIHLITLCLLVEDDQPPHRAVHARARATRTVRAATGLDDWPVLAPPADRGTTTLVDVARSRGQVEAVFWRWVEDCWGAWHEHHPVVRSWAEGLLRST